MTSWLHSQKLISTTNDGDSSQHRCQRQSSFMNKIWSSTSDPQLVLHNPAQRTAHLKTNIPKAVLTKKVCNFCDGWKSVVSTLADGCFPTSSMLSPSPVLPEEECTQRRSFKHHKRSRHCLPHENARLVFLTQNP